MEVDSALTARLSSKLSEDTAFMGSFLFDLSIETRRIRGGLPLVLWCCRLDACVYDCGSRSSEVKVRPWCNLGVIGGQMMPSDGL